MNRTWADAATAFRQLGEIIPDFESCIIAILVTAQGVAEVRSVSREEAGAAGSAMTAAVQQKIFADMAACSRAWVDPHLGESTRPNNQLDGCCEKVFPHFVAALKAMRPTWLWLRGTALA